jgi:hypothetical protein
MLKGSSPLSDRPAAHEHSRFLRGDSCCAYNKHQTFILDVFSLLLLLSYVDLSHQTSPGTWVECHTRHFQNPDDDDDDNDDINDIK